ncbi:phosphotransferase [Pseudonocardia alni]|uniref:phosphotransferase n=1 Tax=Pseudonocardia alni TaxID=33907 RepID=UPI0034D78589
MIGDGVSGVVAGTVPARRPVRVHGDLAPGNLASDEDRLSVVIDVECCSVGVPSCDRRPALRGGTEPVLSAASAHAVMLTRPAHVVRLSPDAEQSARRRR